MPATVDAAEPAPGALEITASADKVAPGSHFLIRLANIGDAPVTSITISSVEPDGLTTTIDPAALPLLAAKSSTVLDVVLMGAPDAAPSQVTISAHGITRVGSTVAISTVDLVSLDPSLTMTIAGNSKLTDASPADLVVVLSNTGASSRGVRLAAQAGQSSVSWVGEDGEPLPGANPQNLELEVAGRASTSVRARVEASEPLRRGTTAVVVTATVKGPQGNYDVVATKALETALSTDVLPSPIGLGSVIFVPGLIAVWAWLAVGSFDRRRRGLTARPVGSQIWDNKLWLLGATAISVVGAWAYSTLGYTNLFDTYALRDIVVLSIVGGVLAALLAWITAGIHGRSLPPLRGTWEHLEVLRAAAKFDNENSRRVYKTKQDKYGLLVKRPNGAVVLCPPVLFTEMDDVAKAVNEGAPLTATIALLQKGARKDLLRFSTEARFVRGPEVLDEAEKTDEELDILQQQDLAP